jgi:hypothetical protein
VSLETAAWVFDRTEGRLMSKSATIAWAVGAISTAAAAGSALAAPSAAYLQPRPSVGERLSNVFSIASSVKVAGFDELVRRNGGTADYVFVGEQSDQSLKFSDSDRYDGVYAATNAMVIRDQGAEVCVNATCRPYSDASGLTYNVRLWGAPPRDLHEGMSWTVDIAAAWELGPAGTQRVSVVRLDRASRCVVLRREGSASGVFANEKLSVDLVQNGKTVTFQVKPGLAHWSGLTTFCHGLVFSDELLVNRTDQFEAAGTGPVTALRRRYMLLNAAPYPTL